MAHFYQRIFVSYDVTFDNHDNIHTLPRQSMTTKITSIDTVNATGDAAVNDLTQNHGWEVVAAVPVIKTINHKPDRQEVAIPYTYTAGVDVILFK